MTHEIENLAGLLQDFGTPEWPASRADKAFDAITRRSEVLVALVERGVEWMDDDASDGFGVFIELLIRHLHAFLFSGMLTNAGQYRTGPIGFGGTRHQTTQHRFEGTVPKRIQPEMQAACRRLADFRRGAASARPEVQVEARLAATDAAVLFYKDLSAIHPFYDANGRIGRFVVSVYLLAHGRYVRWGDIDRAQSAFFHKINACIDRRHTADGGRLLRTYEGYLVDFWRRYVDDVPDEGPDES